MNNGMTKAQTVEMVQGIDLIGMTLCLAQSDGKMPPSAVQGALIHMLGMIRAQLADSYGLEINPLDAVTNRDGDMRKHLSPADVAEQILRDLDGDTN